MNFKKCCDCPRISWEISKVLPPMRGIRKKIFNTCKFTLLSFSFFFSFLSFGYAGDVTLEWDANTEPTLAGYKLYYKTASSGSPYNGTGATEGNSSIDVGNVTVFTLTGLNDNESYYFAVTAYDDGAPPSESGYSNEVQLAPGTTPPEPA